MRKTFIIFSFIIFSFVFQIFYLYPVNNSSELHNQEKIHLSAEELQWLENPDFTSQQFWYSSIQGDESDVNATIGDGQANFKVLGDSGIFELIANPPSDSEWANFSNPDLPVLPDNCTIDPAGILVEHDWDGPTEQLENNPSIHFKQNITMPVNMSDFIITSALIQVRVNATVTVSPINRGIEREGDSAQYLIGDYIHFYALISDVKNTYSYSIAEYKTIDLGKDGPPEIDVLNDTYLIPVPEDILIAYLTSILKIDNFNFTITLRIDIYCEDNLGGTDRDYWNEIRINYFKLNFTYMKKIDRFTSVSWNQDGDKISDISENQVVVVGAILNFDYKIDREWPTLSSPNSEIRILLNNNKHTETIKLSSANSTFQEAKIGGFSVTTLITDDVNLSIQVYIADTFELDRIITISIDDVYLDISYIILYSGGKPEPGIFSVLFIIAIAITVGLGGYLIAYQKILKYPKTVRKVRKYRRTLKKKKDPEVNIISRERAFEKIYAEELNITIKHLKSKLIEQKEKLGIKIEEKNF